jgi:hypothetical protein
MILVRRGDAVRHEGDTTDKVPCREAASIEAEPEFARFLAFLSQDAWTRPETLVNVVDLTSGDEDLFAGVETDLER